MPQQSEPAAASVGSMESPDYGFSAFDLPASTEKEKADKPQVKVDTENAQGNTTESVLKAAEQEGITGSNSTDSLTSEEPITIEPKHLVISSETQNTCILSVSCKEIFGNVEGFNKDKLEILPEDGIIFPAAEVAFSEGESVFNVLQREMERAHISMEFVNTPLYNSVYIEGINNLYEYDCGELSGWMYKVNDLSPNYSCSCYKLQKGDVIEWLYTCNLLQDSVPE